MPEGGERRRQNTPSAHLNLRPHFQSLPSRTPRQQGSADEVELPGGRGRLEESAAIDEPSPVSKNPLHDPEKSPEAMTVAVTDFLAGLRLTGSERVFGALALALAEGMDASPAYDEGQARPGVAGGHGRARQGRALARQPQPARGHQL